MVAAKKTSEVAKHGNGTDGCYDLDEQRASRAREGGSNPDC